MNNKIYITVSTDRELNKISLRDHSVNIVKCLLNAVPVIGGSLASLIEDYIPSQKEERLIEFTEGLGEKLSRVCDSIRHEYIKSDEFSFLFEQCYKNAALSYHKEVLEALQAILINSAMDFEASQDIKEEFVRIIGILRPPHIKLLNYFGNTYYIYTLENQTKPKLITDKEINTRRKLFNLGENLYSEVEIDAEVAAWKEKAHKRYAREHYCPVNSRIISAGPRRGDLDFA